MKIRDEEQAFLKKYRTAKEYAKRFKITYAAATRRLKRLHGAGLLHKQLRVRGVKEVTGPAASEFICTVREA